MNTLVLQHIACEPPGVYEDVLLERGATIHRVELDDGDPLPDWREFSAIVAMGGPMSVNDERGAALAPRREGVDRGGGSRGRALLRRLPWQPAPRRSLGGEVAPGPAPEVGCCPSS